MPINGEQFLRGETIEHISSALYVYEGRIKTSNMWGAYSNEHEVFHVIASMSGDLYLEPDKVFQKNYGKPGTFSNPKPGQVWVENVADGDPYRVEVHAVIDNIVVYDRAGKDYVPDSYLARTVDNFTRKFRRSFDGD